MKVDEASALADGVLIRDCAHRPRIELVAAERIVGLCLWSDRGLGVTVYAARGTGTDKGKALRSLDATRGEAPL